MENNIISENTIKTVLDKILNEEAIKLKREEYNKVQFKIDELNSSLNETIKELRKLQDAIPGGLKGVMTSKVTNISNNLSTTQKLITQLKEKVKNYKRTAFTQQVEERKKK
jgi:hypothetical protein